MGKVSSEKIRKRLEWRQFGKGQHRPNIGKISAAQIWVRSASKNKGKTSKNNIFERLVKFRYGNLERLHISIMGEVSMIKNGNGYHRDNIGKISTETSAK